MNSRRVQRKLYLTQQESSTFLHHLLSAYLLAIVFIEITDCLSSALFAEGACFVHVPEEVIVPVVWDVCQIVDLVFQVWLHLQNLL